MEEEKKDTDLENGADDGADTTDNGEELTKEQLQAQLAEERARRQKMFERAKRAEGFVRQSDGTWVKLQKTEDKKPEATQDTNSNAQLTEELKLIAKGLSDEEIEQAKVVSRGKGISLTEALKDPLFTSYQKDLKEQEKKEKAKLGASRGSDNGGEEPIFKSGMTREEHKAAWLRTQGK